MRIHHATGDLEGVKEVVISQPLAERDLRFDLQ